MRSETKKSWYMAILRSLWGLIGTIYFFGILDWTGIWEVPWPLVMILSVGITIFMVFWWWLAEWISRTFQFPVRAMRDGHNYIPHHSKFKGGDAASGRKQKVGERR